MENEINLQIAEAKFPLSIQAGRYLFLLVDTQGRIVEDWGRPYHIHQNDIVLQIRKKKNLFECFDFGGVDTLAQIADPIQFFPCRNEAFSITTLGAFFSKLPICAVSLNPVNNGRFLAVVAVSDFLPNIHYPKTGALICVDENDALVAFNEAFYLYFAGRYAVPSQLLGTVCSSLFSPSPAQLQSQNLSPIERGKADPVRVFSLDDIALKPDAIDIEEPPGWTREGSRARWRNAGNTQKTVTVLHSLDLTQDDFCAEISLSVAAGSPPLLILGGRRDQVKYVEQHGYTLGTNVHSHRFFLKKYGFVVAQSSEAFEGGTGETRLRLEKRGRALFFTLNGREMIRFFDFEPFDGREAYFSLGLRDGCKADLLEMTLSVYARKNPIPQEDYYVRLKTDTERHFTINHFFNDALSGNYPEVRGYVLRDITRLLEEVNRFRGLYQVEKREGEKLRALLRRSSETDIPFLGNSAPVRAIREKVDVIAHSDATILLQGETGTGKEVLAHYIHQRSPFSKGPFVKVDCSTLAPTLVETELFGHEKGAFTGAVQEKRGKFEQAGGGTLFLDEVNNLSRDIQAKILGFLQDFTITRVGGEKPVRLQLRIIIASNIALSDMVKQGLFREDLFFRINILAVELPPLRSRRDDLPELCAYFLNLFSAQYGKKLPALSPGAFRKLFDYAWPGNIRELRNVIQRAVIFCETADIGESLIQISPAGAPASPAAAAAGRPPAAGRPSPRAIMESVDRDKLREILQKNRGKIRAAARELGVSRQSLYYNLKKYGVKAGEFRSRLSQSRSKSG